MWLFLQMRWFLISLVLLIGLGLVLGILLDAARIDALSNLVSPSVTTMIVLFLMAFSLESRHLGAAFRAPGPVLWGSFVNYGVVPLLAWPLMAVQTMNDFGYGLMIAASVPCTLATASVWTRKAGGNDAVSLLVTLLTNAFCFLLTPLWLKLATAHDVQLDTGEMMVKLIQAVLIPTLLGQLARQPARLAAFAHRYRTPIGVVAQVLVLLMVFYAACNAGKTLAGPGEKPGIAGAALVWICCIVVHVVAMAVGWWGGRGFGFRWRDRVAIAFASSQKTLPIGLLIAMDPKMFGSSNVPFAVFPMLMYHASQLFIDTAVAESMHRDAARHVDE